MNILFANSGDIGTRIKTIISLPDDSSPHLRIILNDKDQYVTARNLILLLLAIASKDDLVTAECAVHFWYSQFVPEWCLSFITEQVGPLLQHVPMFPDPGSDTLSQNTFGPGVNEVGKVIYMTAHLSFGRHAMSKDRDWIPKDEFAKPYNKTWKFGRDGSLEMKINRWRCSVIFTTLFFNGPPGLSRNTPKYFTTALKGMMKPWNGKYKNRDDWDEKLDMVTPAWRVAVKKYYEETIVLPFGHYQTADWLPNPNFFPIGGQDTVMKVMSDPLNAWAMDEVIKANNGGAQNDVYSKLFYHVREQFKRFVSRIRTLSVDIEIYCNDAKALPAVLPGIKFDRIVISDLNDDPVWDTHRIIQILSPMLKDESANHHATVIEEKALAQCLI